MSAKTDHVQLKETFIDLVSGMSAGLVNVAVGLPMDTVKVKMQTFPRTNPTMLRCFYRTIKSDGVFRGLYAGVAPSLVANVGENAVLFVAYGECQNIIAKLRGFEDPDDMDPLGNALSGSSAAFFSAMVLCPTEHIKCQLQVRRELSKQNPEMKNIGSYQLTKEIIQSDGFQGLYRGIKPTWCRELPGYFCFFGGYETARTVLSKFLDIPKDEFSLPAQLMCGAMAGITFWMGIFPLDVIKSRIQVMGETGTMREVAQRVYSNYGIAGFYKGLPPCIMRAFPATASLLATYEYVSHFLKKKMLKKEKRVVLK